MSKFKVQHMKDKIASFFNEYCPPEVILGMKIKDSGLRVEERCLQHRGTQK